MEEQALTVLRDQVGAIMLGTMFLLVGLISCAISALRPRKGKRILLWFGLLNILWGARILAYAPAAFALLPRSWWASRLDVIAILSYVTVVPGLLYFLEMSRGVLRRFLQIMLLAELPICAAGVGAVLFTKSPYRFIHFNNVLVVLLVLLIALVVSVPGLSERFGFPRHRVSQLGLLATGLAALYANLRGFFGFPEYRVLEPLAFAVLMFSLGYVAAEKIFSDGRRLSTIENELALAREIQTSILPTGIPQMTSLNISAVYRPMTAVAGDFYEFIPVDEHRVGFLVADASGHGVPAALIASMIKVAMQSLVHCAHRPGEVLTGLNRILSGQMRSQLVSAAYLWLDMRNGIALYSAAGHPPLFRWRQGSLERIDSNGILIGVVREADYPVCEIPFDLGDRFLLYTDGITEPENAAGDSFGDREFEEVVRRNQSRSTSELSEDLLAGVRRWQPPSVTQQDDITLIVIDVAQAPWNTHSEIVETTQASLSR
jgi:sigma-B regulation protein RsbU (phosphoserine phosphatase)